MFEIRDIEQFVIARAASLGDAIAAAEKYKKFMKKDYWVFELRVVYDTTMPRKEF